MEVLKDGAAAAIYGSVAANGVIIVTTKNGKKGDMKIDFSTYVSFTSVAKKLELLNAEEYKSVHKQMYQNYMNQYPNDTEVTMPAFVNKNTGIDTDWQDAMLRSGGPRAADGGRGCRLLRFARPRRGRREDVGDVHAGEEDDGRGRGRDDEDVPFVLVHFFSFLVDEADSSGVGLELRGADGLGDDGHPAGDGGPGEPALSCRRRCGSFGEPQRYIANPKAARLYANTPGSFHSHPVRLDETGRRQPLRYGTYRSTAAGSPRDPRFSPAWTNPCLRLGGKD